MLIDQDFLACMAQRAHRRLYTHWCARAPSGRLPGRQHIDLGDFMELVASIGEIEVHRDQTRLFFRHGNTGAEIVRRIGRDPAGYSFEDLYRGSELIQARVRHIEVVAKRKPELTNFVQPSSTGHSVEDRRLILPLASDGELVDRLIYLAIF